MPEKKSYTIAGRSLRMPGLKATDYFLFKEIKEYFGYDMRQVFTLGLRWIYAAWHDPKMRQSILSLANTINHENLDGQEQRIEYHTFKDIIGSSERP